MGTVSNYTQIAQNIDRPKAIRAVGTAVGKNPLLIVIPCHRVLTKTGELGGYRGGLEMKQALLSLEIALHD
jgi:O-6-methylguanine DNA methyltransferase